MGEGFFQNTLSTNSLLKNYLTNCWSPTFCKTFMVVYLIIHCYLHHQTSDKTETGRSNFSILQQLQKKKIKRCLEIQILVAAINRIHLIIEKLQKVKKKVQKKQRKTFPKIPETTDNKQYHFDLFLCSYFLFCAIVLDILW